jgi:hypothetical protein
MHLFCTAPEAFAVPRETAVANLEKSTDCKIQHKIHYYLTACCLCTPAYENCTTNNETKQTVEVTNQ